MESGIQDSLGLPYMGRNLFLLGLAPSGAGKTPACNIVCVSPISSHLEPRIDQNILIDETSSNGLFNHIVNFHKGLAGESVCILCIDEGYTFLNKLISITNLTFISIYALVKSKLQHPFWESPQAFEFFYIFVQIPSHRSKKLFKCSHPWNNFQITVLTFF